MDTIRIALVGLGSRGRCWAELMQKVGGYRITAVCDPIVALHAQCLAGIEYRDDVRAYTRYEDVLADPNVDAVAMTARCEDQGAMAARALEVGKHVNSEVPAAHTIEDCWRLVVAAENSGALYLLAEQMRHAGFVAPWRDLVASGQLGRITLCEGQYFHHYVGKSFQDPRTGRHYEPGDLRDHPEARPTWLRRMPPIHYLPHELSPMMKVLDDRVVEVTAMSTRPPGHLHPELDSPDMQVALMKTEKDAICRMAVSFSQLHPPRDFHWYQVVGTRGCLECRRSERDRPKMWLADWQMHGMAEVDWRLRRPDAPPQSEGTSHDGLDYYVQEAFRDALLRGRPLDIDVYRAVETAAPAILAARSIAEGTAPMRVPDFRPNELRPAGQMPRTALEGL